MNVIFLDIDGFLNSSNYFDETSNIFYNYIDYIENDLFQNYDEELLFNLIYTNIYNNGLNDYNYKDAIYKIWHL